MFVVLRVEIAGVAVVVLRDAVHVGLAWLKTNSAAMSSSSVVSSNKGHDLVDNWPLRCVCPGAREGDGEENEVKKEKRSEEKNKEE
jgi:hypothetical protein